MKKILAMLLACVMVFSSATVCFAADNTELSDKVTKEVATSMLGEGTPLPITIDGEPMTRATPYEASGSTDGYIGGAIYVPEGGANVRIAWRAQAVSSSGSGGVFRLAVGNYEVYLPSNQSARYYSIGWLDGGRHSFEISPYSGTSGTYVYVLQFVS